MIEPFTIDIVSDFPEHVGLRFTTNGSQDGDAGHGGKATLEFIVESGIHTVGLDKRPQIDIGEGSDHQTVSFTARGDWEMDGLVKALIELGDRLRAECENMTKALVVAECERCGGKWLIEAGVEPGLLQGMCNDCQNESDVERPLTFRTPRGIESQMAPDEKDLVTLKTRSCTIWY
jgi:hypothetical protein